KHKLYPCKRKSGRYHISPSCRNSARLSNTAASFSLAMTSVGDVQNEQAPHEQGRGHDEVANGEAAGGRLDLADDPRPQHAAEVGDGINQGDAARCCGA